MKNSTRSWAFLSLLSLSFILIGHLIAAREGLLWGFAIAITINTVVYFYSDLKLTHQYKAREIEGQDSWNITTTLIQLSRRVRIPTPRAFIFECETPQALVLGRNWASGKVLLSNSLIQLLTPQELRAILAYQVICIKNFDTLAFTIAGTLANGIMVIPQKLDQIIALALGPKWEFQKSGQITAWVFAPLAALVIRFCINPKSLVETDKLAAELCGHPEDLAQALWKVQSYQTTLPQNVSAPFSHLFFISPLIGQSWTKYFKIHPETSDRIKNLIGYYPL